MMSSFSVREVGWLQSREALSAVRKAVFVDEQGVPEALEWDGLDAGGRHLLAEDALGGPIGTVRLLGDGHIGRMAVMPKLRGKGVGRALLDEVLRLARRHEMGRLYLNAQVAATGFYERAGFRQVGEEFMDAGIPHRRMELS